MTEEIKETKKEEKKKKKKGNILLWVFGILFIIVAIASITENILLGLFILLVGIFALPKTSKYLDEKFNIKIKPSIQAISLVVGFIIFGIFTPKTSEVNVDNTKNQNINNIVESQKADSNQQSDINYQTESSNVTDTENAAEAEPKKDTQFIEQLQREINSIKTFNNTNYRDSVTAIQIEAVLFTVWADLIKKAKNDTDIEIKQLGNDLENKVIQLQIKEFPLMRKVYGELMATTLWEHNIDVKVYGSANSTIELVGALFANNKNVKDTQTTLSDMLHTLRFDRVNYKWYKYDDEYTYYTIDSHKDNELVGANEL